MSEEITEEQLKAVMPKSVQRAINAEMIGVINNLINNTDLRANYRDNILGYTSVMAEGKYRLRDYLSAVMYVSYKLLNNSNVDAYVKTFPDRYQRLVNLGKTTDDIGNFVTAYNKTQLVQKIYAQTMTPHCVLNQDMYQKALNVQVELMLSAKSEKVRSDAANSILTHLKPPETQKIELDIGVKEDSSIAALRASTMELVAAQKKVIEAGVQDAQQVAHGKLLIEDAEYVEDV